jgi:hypothetical protein
MARTRTILAVVSLLLIALGGGAAIAADIVTVPTANQLGAGEVDLAHYYIDVDQGSLIAPLRPLEIGWVRVQTLYVGITDRIEIDAHRHDVDGMPEQTIWVASVLVLEENETVPNVVVGARDASNTAGHTSFYVSAAKTINPPVGGPPSEPIVRLHLSLGTEDNTLFGEERHQGLFGGVQILLKPSSPAVGLVGLYDGTDVITGITVVLRPGWPTVKAGTYGGHWWLGANYTFNSK